MVSQTENGALKTAAVVLVDADRGGLGLRSRGLDVLAGRSVLRRTVERLAGVDELDEIVVFCPAEQVENVAQEVRGTAAVVEGLAEKAGPDPYVRRRKWSLASWRGGIGEATVFDEQQFTGEMVAKLKGRGVGHVLSVGAEAVFVDPVLAGGLVRHYHENGETMRFSFSQAACGLAGCMFRIDLVEGLVRAGAHVGALLAYNPDSPHADYINQECTYQIDSQLCRSRVRYLADTERSFRMLEKVLAKVRSNGRVALVRDVVRAAEEVCSETDKLPRELELEINTERSVRIEGYPHSQATCERGPMSVGQFAKIVGDCSEYDDICLTIGGVGEPLAHRELPEMVQAAKEAGIFGINVETDGLRLEGRTAEALLASEVDVVSVWIDADGEEMYREVKGQGGFEKVAGQVEEFAKASAEKAGPMVVPHLVKTRETMGQMEAFYDRWVRCCGAAAIVGHNDFAGQIADRAVMNMAPPRRAACRRLGERMTILADGTVPVCGQDFRGRSVVGNALEQSVGEIWQSDGFERLRRAHGNGEFGVNELCAKCREWHR